MRACTSGVSGSFGSGGSEPVDASQAIVTSFCATTVVTAPSTPAYSFHRIFSDKAMVSLSEAAQQGSRDADESIRAPDRPGGVRFTNEEFGGIMGHVDYVERLRVPSWWWLVVAFFVLSLAVAVFAYLPAWTAAAVTAALGGGVVLVVIGYGSSTLRVDGSGLRVGHSSIEGRWISGVEALDAGAASAALGRDADHRDFLHTRPYIAGGVRVTLSDPADPHPHWIISTRRPAELARAISEMVAAQ